MVRLECGASLPGTVTPYPAWLNWRSAHNRFLYWLWGTTTAAAAVALLAAVSEAR